MKPEMKKILIEEGITALFLALVLGTLPWMTQRLVLLATAMTSFLLFSLIRKSHFLIPSFEAGSTSKDPKLIRDEFLNRAASMIFNLSTGIPTYLSYYHLLPPFWWLTAPHTVETKIPIACAWSFGYIVYDFFYLNKSNVVMRMHHVGEMVICLTNAYVPSIGTPYMLGGACTQISSFFLHSNKIIFDINRIQKKETPLRKSLGQIVHNLLIAFWVHGRLILFPLFMYSAFVNNPMSALHFLNMLTGVALVGASAFWLYKIVKKSSNNSSVMN